MANALVICALSTWHSAQPLLAIARTRPSETRIVAELSEEERRTALRLPPRPPPAELDDTGDPLGDRGDAMLSQANFRVQRRAAAGEYNNTAPSRSLPLVALVAQVGLGGTLCAGLGYCCLLNSEAEAGAAWAVDALAHSDEWWFGQFGTLWGKPPGGPLALLYAAGNGLNALRCAPLLFDRLIVTRAPRSPTGARDGDEDDDAASSAGV